MVRPCMVVVAGPPGSGKTTYFPVTAFGVDGFNIDDRCAQNSSECEFTTLRPGGCHLGSSRHPGTVVSFNTARRQRGSSSCCQPDQPDRAYDIRECANCSMHENWGITCLTRHRTPSATVSLL